MSAATPALAQGLAGRWEVSGFGGAFSGSRLLTSPTVDVTTATGPAYGARVAYAFTRVLSLEGGWSHADSKLEPQDAATGASLGPSPTLKVNTFELEGLFGFGPAPTRGYVGLGAGVMNLSPDVTTADSSAGTTAFTANIAVGGKLFLSDNVAVRVDARYRWRTSDEELGAVVCNALGCSAFETRVYTSVEVTGGLIYRF